MLFRPNWNRECRHTFWTSCLFSGISHHRTRSVHMYQDFGMDIWFTNSRGQSGAGLVPSNPLSCWLLQNGAYLEPEGRPVLASDLFSCPFFQDAGSQQIGFLLGSCGVTVALTSDACHKGLPKSPTGEIPQFKGVSLGSRLLQGGT